MSEKGGVSVYGLDRFPVTLYEEQWTKLIAMADKDSAVYRGERHPIENQPFDLRQGEVRQNSIASLAVDSAAKCATGYRMLTVCFAIMRSASLVG